MTRLLPALTCLAVLVACGGGSVGTAVDPDPVISMDTNKVSPVSSSYRAVFDCDARITLNGIPGNVTGTYTLQTESGTVLHPQTTLIGKPVRNTIVLSALGQTYELTVDEYVYNDKEGRWWSLGGEDAEGTRSWWSDDPPATYPDPIGQVAGRILNLDSHMTLGQRIEVPPTDALSDDLTTVLFTRSNTREVMAIEVINTPLGKFECYRVEATETIDKNDGSDPVTVDFVRWERPDMGLIKMHAENIDVSNDTYDITVHEADCIITSYTP